jgi:hypothetical protein
LADVTDVLPIGSAPKDLPSWLLWIAGGTISSLVAYILWLQRRITTGQLVARSVVEDIQRTADARIAEVRADRDSRVAELAEDRATWRTAAGVSAEGHRDAMRQLDQVLDGFQTVEHLLRALPQPRASEHDRTT